MGHLHCRDLGAGGAILHHVPHKNRCKALPGADHTIWSAEELAPPHWCCGSVSSTANTYFTVAIHRAEDGNGFTHAYFDGPGRQANQGFRTGAFAGTVHVEIQANA